MTDEEVRVELMALCERMGVEAVVMFAFGGDGRFRGFVAGDSPAAIAAASRIGVEMASDQVARVEARRNGT